MQIFYSTAGLMGPGTCSPILSISRIPLVSEEAEMPAQVQKHALFPKRLPRPSEENWRCRHVPQSSRLAYQSRGTRRIVDVLPISSPPTSPALVDRGGTPLLDWSAAAASCIC